MELLGRIRSWAVVCAPPLSARAARRGDRPSPDWARKAMLFVVLVCATLPVAAQEKPPSEYQVKAAFLVNFPKYVDWPPEAFEQPDSPLFICVYGEDKLGEDLKRMVEAKTINNRPLTLRYPRNPQELREGCHVLFVGGSDRQKISEALQAVRASSVLTVGESDFFLELGGVINMGRKEDRIRLAVNLDAAERARLKVSAKLLNVADVKQRENK